MPLSSRSILPHMGFKPCSDNVWEVPKQNDIKKKKEKKIMESNL